MPQKVLNILLPAGAAPKVRSTAHAPSLEEARGVPLLQCHREAGVPGVEESDFAPMASSGDLRVVLGYSVDRAPQEPQRLCAPAPEGLDGEGTRPPPGRPYTAYRR